MEFAIIFAAGIVVGCILMNVVRRTKSIGVLRVDTSDPDGPYIFLELDKGDAEALAREKYVLMRVKLRGYIPHK